MKRVIRSTEDINTLNKADMLHHLKLLDKKLGENGMHGEIDLYGGAVMCLGLNARESTHDIDAVFAPKREIYELIEEIAEENHLPADWLNDGVKGFVSPNAEFFRYGEDEFKNLSVFMTSPQYLFAMKCLSCRMESDHPAEINDIKFLANYLNITTVDAAENLILEYYPASMFKPKTHYMLLELLGQ